MKKIYGTFIIKLINASLELILIIGRMKTMFGISLRWLSHTNLSDQSRLMKRSLITRVIKITCLECYLREKNQIMKIKGE